VLRPAKVLLDLDQKVGPACEEARLAPWRASNDDVSSRFAGS
jgi:hypothetical protein